MVPQAVIGLIRLGFAAFLAWYHGLILWLILQKLSDLRGLEDSTGASSSSGSTSIGKAF